MNAVTLNLNSVIQLTDEQFFELCRANPDVKFERNATGEEVLPGFVLEMEASW